MNDPSRSRVPALILLILSWSVFFFNLGEISLWDPDEPRGAVIAHEILGNDDWIHLFYNGEPVTNNPALVKPPLYYWSIAAVSGLLGEVNEFSARLPSALAGIGTVLLVFLLGQQIFGPRAALLGGLIFISNHMIFEQARSAEIDMTLCFFTTFSLYLFYGFYHGLFSSWNLLAAYLAMGLAVLAKGPVGAILPVMVAGIYLVWQRDLKALTRLRPLTGLVIVLAVASPWFILEGKAFGIEFFFRQNFDRFFQAFDHQQPIYYYVTKLAVHFAPWSFLLPVTAVYWIQKNKEKNRGRLFLLIWFFAMFIFFSLSQSKRSLYIVPLYPAISLLLGEMLDQLLNQKRFENLLPWLRGGVMALVVFLVLAAGTGLFMTADKFPELLVHAVAAALFLVVCAVLLFRGIRRPGSPGVLAALFVLAFGLEFLMAGVIYPELDVRSRSSKKLSQMVAQKVGEKDLGCVGFHPPSAIFYINRERRKTVIDFGYKVEAGIAFLKQEQTVYCLMKRSLYERDRERLEKISRSVHLPGLPLKGWKWDLVFLTNRLSPEPRTDEVFI